MNSVKKRTASVKPASRGAKKALAKAVPKSRQVKALKALKPLKKSPPLRQAKPAKPAKLLSPAKPARAISSMTAKKDLPPRGVSSMVHFEFHDPKAKEVYLVGTFNGWEPHATPMKKARDGTWSVNVQLSAGRHEYRILADGHWRDDPKASSYERNPFGGRNSVVDVRP
jgi:hypothetical protein